MAELRDLLLDFDPLTPSNRPSASSSSSKSPLFPSPAKVREKAPPSPKHPAVKVHSLVPTEAAADPLASLPSAVRPHARPRPSTSEADRRTRVRQEALLQHLSREPYSATSRSSTPLVDFEGDALRSLDPAEPSWVAIGQQALDASKALWPTDPDHEGPDVERPLRGSTNGDSSLEGDSLRPIRLSRGPSAARRIADEELAEGIRHHLPRRLRAAAAWQLVYSLDRDGTSINTLYDRVRHHFAADRLEGCILVVQDMDGQRFGAFVNEALRPAKEYYGNGECFLWRSGSSPGQAAVEAFHWTGQNDYMVLADFDLLSVGGGDGKFGLCVDAALEKGVSARCPAFNNSVLCTYGQRSASGREEGRFEVFGLEVFACI